MGLNVTLLLARLAAPFVLLAAATAQAQLVDEVDFRREGADAVLQVRFVTPVQYRRASVPRAGDTVQVFYDLLNPAEGLKDTPSERRVAGGGVMPDITVVDEATPQRARNRRLLVRLSRAVPLRVRAGRGDRQIELVLTGLGSAIPAAAPVTASTQTRGFQIALQRSDGPNLQLDTPIPAALQRYQVFTGQRVLDGRTVYEVNLGYFETLAEAEAARTQLLKRFPQASIVSLAAPPAAAAPLPAPPAPAAAPAPAPAETDAQAAALLAAAQHAEAQQDHAKALEALNQLLNLPANASTREAQALAGLVRERAGDPLRARAEYETFLQLYPTGPDADQVRAALARLPSVAPTAAVAAAPAKPETPSTSTITGSVSEFYYGGASKVRTQEFQDSPISGLPELVSDDTLSDVDQKQWQTSVDLNWRYRDADTDMRFVFRDAYTLDQLNSAKNRNRLSALYFEHRSLALGTSVKLGRQSPTGMGVLGRYDGAQASWTFVPKWRVSAVAGVPADKLLDSRRHFYGGAIEADALLPHVSGNLYAMRQMIDGEVDRSAVGTEMRYFNGGVSATGILDWDQAIRGLNIASLQGTWQFEDNSVVNFLYDRRKTPLLMLGNTLFFQDPALPLATRLRDLLDSGATLDSLRDRVRATTSNTTQGLLGATVPINKTWQVGADLRLSDVGEILPVPDILPSGQGRSRNAAVGAQLIGSNLYSARDTHVLGLSLMRGSNYSLTEPVTVARYNAQLVSYNNSSQVNELLLVEPSLRWYRQTDNTGVRIVRWTPGLRLSWRVLQQLALESELSAEFSKSSGPNRNETSDRFFYYLGGRYDF
jgi:tetratricopeptide (TPR) repeat protein